MTFGGKTIGVGQIAEDIERTCRHPFRLIVNGVPEVQKTLSYKEQKQRTAEEVRTENCGDTGTERKGRKVILGAELGAYTSRI